MRVKPSPSVTGASLLMPSEPRRPPVQSEGQSEQCPLPGGSPKPGAMPPTQIRCPARREAPLCSFWDAEGGPPDEHFA